jgi:hypothetical protein
MTTEQVNTSYTIPFFTFSPTTILKATFQTNHLKNIIHKSTSIHTPYCQTHHLIAFMH